MAFVVTRPRGRFEVRESIHTPNGPRARSLVGFHVLTDEVLSLARRRAQRPFDARSTIRSAEKAGAPVRVADPRAGDDARRSFLAATRRMATALERPTPPRSRQDPGMALLELLGFAEAITASRPSRPSEPLEYPALSQLAERRRAVAGGR